MNVLDSGVGRIVMANILHTCMQSKLLTTLLSKFVVTSSAILKY